MPSAKTKLTIPLEFGSVKLRGDSAGKWRFEVETSLSSHYTFAAESSFAANEWAQHLRWQMSPAQPKRPPPVESLPLSPSIAPPPPSEPISVTDEPQLVEAPSAAWNENYQSCMDMEDGSFNTSVAKASRLNHLKGEFVSISMRIGKTIIEEFTLPPHLKTIVPLERYDQNPEDETYVSEDGIAFQFMHNCQGSALADETKKKMASHDLHGVEAYANASVSGAKGLHTFLCCIVDHLGFRLFAQALPPIYDHSRLAFGLNDNVLTVDPDADYLLEAAARAMNLRSHDVPDGATTARIHTSASAQMHRGDDGRLYISNVSTALPLDHNPALPGASDEYVAVTRRFRREFLRSYRRPLSSDAISLTGELGADAEAATTEAIRASRHLVGKVVPDFVKQLNLLDFVPLDSVHLTSLMHQRGINVRYLGIIAEQTLMPHVREMAMCEMVARSCKTLLGERLRALIRSYTPTRRSDSTDDYNLVGIARGLSHQCREGIVEMFNLILGTDALFWKGELGEKVHQKFGYILGADEGSRLHRPLLLAALQYHCGVVLDEHIDLSAKVDRPLQLRHILVVGGRCKFAQLDSLLCHQYPLQADEYLKNGDFELAIQAYQLRIDVVLPRCSDDPIDVKADAESPTREESERPVKPRGKFRLCASLYHHTLNQLCQSYLCKGDLVAARDCARRALDTSADSTSAAHTAITYAHLVSIYRAERQEQLATHSFKLALSMMRRLYGPHAPQILQLYDEVGSRHFEAGESAMAEMQFKHAIDLSLTALGKSHPVTAFFYRRLGNVYHLENCYDRAKDAHEKSCLIYEGLYGPASLDVALSCFYLSDIMSLKGDLKSARYYNQRALQIRLQLLGEHHPLTLDSYHQVAWQAFHREDDREAIPYFEKLLLHYKSVSDPTPDNLVSIRRTTKAVIRLQMRALPMDQVAFLDKLYQESVGRLEERGALMRLVIRKLYDESPSGYVKDLLEKSCRGVSGPGYSEAAPELAVILKLMESGGDENDLDENNAEPDSKEDPFDATMDSTQPAGLMNYSIEKPSGSKEGEVISNSPYSMLNRPSTIVKS